MKLLIVGNPAPEHIGNHFKIAAESESGFQHVSMMDVRAAASSSLWVNRIFWHLFDRSLPHSGAFNRRVLECCRREKPDILLSVGINPLRKEVLEQIKGSGTVLLNYLTDDPWNPQHKSRRCLKALPVYDQIFSVRRSNLEDLKHLGCPNVYFLPFAYAPHIHFNEDEAECENVESYDVLFVGAGDCDRLLFAKAIQDKGFSLGLFGGYWNRFPALRRQTKGYAADPGMVRKLTRRAKISLCLVRRANRDDNVMRTFEIPASGGCPLVEDTPFHRELFGEEGDCVLYFKEPEDMMLKIDKLLSDESLRNRLKDNAHRKVTQGEHTYGHRLREMIKRIR